MPESNQNIMKRTISRAFIGIAAAVLALASCQKEEELRRFNVTMGNIVDGRFVSDQGNTFNIVEQLCPARLDTMTRALLNCDVIRQTAGKEKEYDIRLTQIFSVLTKDVLYKSSEPSESTLGNDAIHLEDLWISGGYMNMSIIIPVKNGVGGRKHLINLVHDDTDMKDNTFIFHIRHNAYGEILGANNSDKTLVRQYVSFPVSSVINQDSAMIELHWKGYKAFPGGLSSETEDYRVQRGYLKSEFEQVPTTITGMMTTSID